MPVRTARSASGETDIGAAARGCLGADDRVAVGRRGAGLERFEDDVRVARAGAHAALGVDADELDARRHAERNRRLVGERHLQEIAHDRRGEMAAGGEPPDMARLVVAHDRRRRRYRAKSR